MISFKMFKLGHDHFFSSFLTTFPVASLWTLWGGALFFLSSTPLTLTILEWMAQEMQYCILMQSLGMMQVSKALFSSRSFLDEASTMSLMVKRLTALSLGQSLPQLTQTIGLTYPLLFLFLPWFLRLTGMLVVNYNSIYLLKLINIQDQQLTMIRTEFRQRINNELESARKKRSRSLKDKSKSSKKDGITNRQNLSTHHKNEGYKGQKIGSLRKALMKQNEPLNQNTPKNLKIHQGDVNMDDVQHMQSIKFISKECSSIKEIHNDDCISFSNSGNNLDDFSPLFDRIQKQNNSKEEFTLEICGIEDSESFYQFTKTKDASIFQKSSRKQENSHAKTGRIKKNNIKCHIITNQKSRKLDFKSEILQIFKTLDHSQNHILSKHNCSSEKLTTQLNYLIGSILNKIKVKSKQYDFNEFEIEFKSLIEDSQQEQILQILQNNRKKRNKLRQATQKDISFEYTQKNIIIQQHSKLKNIEQRQIFSPQFKGIKTKEGVAQKLNKISSKLDNYLRHNNLQGTLKSIEDVNCHHIEYLQNQFVRQFECNQKSRTKLHAAQTFNQTHKLKGSKSTQKYTLSTENSNVSSNIIESFHRFNVSLKNNIEIIKKTDGSAFQLNFTQLNKHLD